MCPVVLTRGADQAPVSTRFQMREDESVMRNYGRMLVDLAAAIPDGIVCFFVSYSYMDKIVSKWNELGVLQARARAPRRSPPRRHHTTPHLPPLWLLLWHAVARAAISLPLTPWHAGRWWHHMGNATYAGRLGLVRQQPPRSL